jgi:hypothetical protein
MKRSLEAFFSDLVAGPAKPLIRWRARQDFDLVTSAFGGRGASQQGHASLHSEITANLLIGFRSNFSIFSECALTNNANHLDFDSAIPRFESSRRAAENIVHEAIICPRCSSLRCSFRNSIPDAFVTRVMQCACGFRAAATARSIGCWGCRRKRRCGAPG